MTVYATSASFSARSLSPLVMATIGVVKKCFSASTFATFQHWLPAAAGIAFQHKTTCVYARIRTYTITCPYD